MNVTLDAVLARTDLAAGLGAQDQLLARRIAGELTLYGVDILPRQLFQGPSGRRLARLACEDIEGIRRMADCFADREHTVTVSEEVEEPATEEGGEPTTKSVTREETLTTKPRVLELAEGHGMVSLVCALIWPDIDFVVSDNDEGRRWLWRRMLISLGARNVRLLARHQRIAPGEWDVVLVKDMAPPKAMDLAGSLLAAGGNLLLWQDRRQAKGLRRRHLDARSQPLHLADAVAMESPCADGRLVARVSSGSGNLDSGADEA
ncbi:hypothetical protein DRQ32_10605 [bacterium]|nr:MAG: hypothetical protein DRQ32_10605 [bacterium]